MVIEATHMAEGCAAPLRVVSAASGCFNDPDSSCSAVCPAAVRGFSTDELLTDMWLPAGQKWQAAGTMPAMLIAGD